jgi:hypothetical protein
MKFLEMRPSVCTCACSDWQLALLTSTTVPQVIKGSYDKVKAAELDELASETAAYLATEHPDYSLLAGRIAVSALHKVWRDCFVGALSLDVPLQGAFAEDPKLVLPNHQEAARVRPQRNR